MADPLDVIASDLGVFLGLDVDEARAQLMIDGAVAAATALCDPVPATAKVLVLSAAARGYSNPQSVSAEGAGPFTVQRPMGIFFTRQERAQLKTLAGRGGAFSVDPTPDGAGQGLQPWDVNVTYLNGVPILEDPR